MVKIWFFITIFIFLNKNSVADSYLRIFSQNQSFIESKSWLSQWRNDCQIEGKKEIPQGLNLKIIESESEIKFPNNSLIINADTVECPSDAKPFTKNKSNLPLIILDPGHDDTDESCRTNSYEFVYGVKTFFNEGRSNMSTSLLIYDFLTRCYGYDSRKIKFTRYPMETEFDSLESGKGNGQGKGAIRARLADEQYSKCYECNYRIAQTERLSKRARNSFGIQAILFSIHNDTQARLEVLPNAQRATCRRDGITMFVANNSSNTSVSAAKVVGKEIFNKASAYYSEVDNDSLKANTILYKRDLVMAKHVSMPAVLIEGFYMDGSQMELMHNELNSENSNNLHVDVLNTLNSEMKKYGLTKMNIGLALGISSGISKFLLK